MNGYVGGAKIKQPKSVPHTPSRFCASQVADSGAQSNNSAAVTWTRSLGIDAGLGFEASVETGFDSSLRSTTTSPETGKSAGGRTTLAATPNNWSSIRDQETSCRRRPAYGDHHLQLIHALVVPIRYNAIGMAEGWPPPRMNITQRGVQWNERVPAIGARLPPGLTLKSRRNLVIGMRPTAHIGTAAGVQVRYRENGRQYLLRTHTEFKVLVAKTAYKLC